MAKILDLPKLSPTMEEGQIAKWHKKEGDAIGVDDLLAEVETDKATMEYRSFDKGTLLKILAGQGAEEDQAGALDWHADLRLRDDRHHRHHRSEADMCDPRHGCVKQVAVCEGGGSHNR